MFRGGCKQEDEELRKQLANTTVRRLSCPPSLVLVGLRTSTWEGPMRPFNDGLVVKNQFKVTILFFWSQTWSHIFGPSGWSWGGHHLYRLNWTIVYENIHHAMLKKTYCKLDLTLMKVSCGNPRSSPLWVSFLRSDSFDIKWRRRGRDTNDRVLRY